MTRCLIKSLYNGDKEMDLSQALTPEALDRWASHGVAEDARDAANRANETLGRLLRRPGRAEGRDRHRSVDDRRQQR